MKSVNFFGSISTEKIHESFRFPPGDFDNNRETFLSSLRCARRHIFTHQNKNNMEIGNEMLARKKPEIQIYNLSTSFDGLTIMRILFKMKIVCGWLDREVFRLPFSSKKHHKLGVNYGRTFLPLSTVIN